MQAILMTAYKNEAFLRKNILLLSKNFKVFVHIDAKSTMNLDDLNSNKNVFIVKKYKINWGGINHLYAILDLLTLAVLDESVNYIHIISGQDKIVKPIKYFNQFDDCKKIYMDCTAVSEIKNPKIKKRYTNGMAFSNLNNKNFLVRQLNFIYGYMHKKKLDINGISNIYKGLIWSSFPKEVGNYVLSYTLRTNILKELKHVLIPEEFFFQTILANSQYSKDIINDNLRYDDWSQRNGSMPAFLDNTDFVKIVKSKNIFARKFDPNISKELLRNIEKTILGG